MPRYQTEIVVPPDRYVCLQMPEHFPAGPATITVLVVEPDAIEADPPRDADPDRQDIEWWEEFEDGTGCPVDDGVA